VNKNYVGFALHISVTLEELSIRNYLRNLTFKVQIVKKLYASTCSALKPPLTGPFCMQIYQI